MDCDVRDIAQSHLFSRCEQAGMEHMDPWTLMDHWRSVKSHLEVKIPHEEMMEIMRQSVRSFPRTSSPEVESINNRHMPHSAWRAMLSAGGF